MTMPTVEALEEVTALVARRPGLFVRWSRGPDVDQSGGDGEAGRSKDALTGVRLPGLSANPLAVEEWWGARPLHLWVARRLYDYSHLKQQKGPGVRPWILEGEECGRGPDNEPLVHCRRPVAWIAESVLREAERLVEDQSHDWGPLRRRA